MKEQESTTTKDVSAVTKLEIDLELDKLLDELAMEVRKKQRQRKWSYEVFESKVQPHLGHSAFNDVMMGRRNPTLKTLLIIAKALGYGIRIEFTRP